MYPYLVTVFVVTYVVVLLQINLRTSCFSLVYCMLYICICIMVIML